MGYPPRDHHGSVGHPALGGQVVDEPVHPGPQRDVGRVSAAVGDQTLARRGGASSLSVGGLRSTLPVLGKCRYNVPMPNPSLTCIAPALRVGTSFQKARTGDLEEPVRRCAGHRLARAGLGVRRWFLLRCKWSRLRLCFRMVRAPPLSSVHDGLPRFPPRTGLSSGRPQMLPTSNSATCTTLRRRPAVRPWSAMARCSSPHEFTGALPRP